MDLLQSCVHCQQAEPYHSTIIVNQTGHKIVPQSTQLVSMLLLCPKNTPFSSQIWPPRAYRVTIPLVLNLLLTSEQKFRFGLACPGLARPKRNFHFEVNRRFWTSGMVTLYLRSKWRRSFVNEFDNGPGSVEIMKNFTIYLQGRYVMRAILQ